MTETHYVCGFLFSSERSQVVLIEKNRPDFQAGRLNGVGGKVEPGETRVSAMVREFEEETGIKTEHRDWTEFCYLYDGPVAVTFFKARSPAWVDVRTTTDERVVRADPADLPDNVLPNLRWLIPMAMNSSVVDAEVVLGDVMQRLAAA
jgi:8-oxo-dGTP diphosphatase